MKVLLMFEDRNLELRKNQDPRDKALCDDLELKSILHAMSGGDDLILEVCSQVLLSPLQKISEMEYRQEIMADALAHPRMIGDLYALCVDTEERRKNVWFSLHSFRISSTFSTAVSLLEIYLDSLLKLRQLAEKNKKDCASRGLRRFFSMLEEELSDEYFAEIRPLQYQLNSTGDLLISAEFGSYLQGIHYTLRQRKNRRSRLQWLFAPSFTIADRDDAGANDLALRRDRAINEAANALAQSAEHLEQFFALLRRELAFYMGAIRLRDRLQEWNLPVCLPEMRPGNFSGRTWEGLYDMSLALTLESSVVGNGGKTENQNLVIITGANQGGKTTFLRSVGQAQLMAQCGLFAGARRLILPLRGQIFTHFKREEDRSMERGKLEEELDRMSRIADRLREHDLILFNESFSSTNEREGSRIFSQITRALLDRQVEVFSVTHLFAYASCFLDRPGAAFLRAQRLPDGKRTFQLLPEKPLETAFGEDIYRKVFGKQENNS